MDKGLVPEPIKEPRRRLYGVNNLEFRKASEIICCFYLTKSYRVANRTGYRLFTCECKQESTFLFSLKSSVGKYALRVLVRDSFCFGISYCTGGVEIGLSSIGLYIQTNP